MPIDIATGAVYLEYEDVNIPGKVDLVWDRHYNTALLERQTGPLGRGWTSRYFATLTRKPGEYEFFTPEGAVESFLDPDAVVEGGGIVRNFGAFLEIFKSRDRYVVRSWDVESGEIWQYGFNPGPAEKPWQLSTIEDVTGQALDLAYDRTGRLVSVRQHLENRALVLTWNSADRIDNLQLQDPDGRRHPVARYEYDDTGALSAAFDALGNADRFEYDRQGRLSREIAKHGGVFSHRYDDKDRCVLRTGLDRYDEKRLRYLDAARTTEVTDSTGAVFMYRWLPDGQIESEWDPLGAETKTGYDDYARIVSKATPGGATTLYEYDEQGNRNKIVDPVGNTYLLEFNDSHQPTTLTDPNGNLWQRHFDRSNRLVASTDPFGARWTVQYDEQGNLITLTNPRGHSRSFRYRDGVLTEDTDWIGNPTRLAFDPFGRVATETDPLGATIRYGYDAVGNLIRAFLPDDAQIQAFYNAGGDLVRLVDPEGRVTVRRFGPCGRLLERVDPNGNKVAYGWGTEPDRLEKVINERGEVYRLFYNEAGYCTREVSFDGREYQFGYDLAGWCVKTTNGAGETIEIGRDPLGRIVSQALPDGSVARYAYDKLGNLVEAINPECAVRLERDGVGRLVREVQGDHWVGYAHDALGEITRMETDLGLRVDYDLDPNGFWKSLRTGEGHAMQFSRDAAGREVERRLPGGLSLAQRYDPLGRLIEQRLARRGHGGYDTSGWGEPNANALVQRGYSRDASGLVQTIDDRNSGKTSYAYDPGERLLQVLRDRGPSERFEYDATGNITRAVTEGRDGVEDAAFEYGLGNRLLRKGTTRYEYDAQGRLVCKAGDTDSPTLGIWQYEWDALDQLRSVIRPDGEVWRYGYDALGRRVRKTGPGEEVRFVWKGNVPVHELSGEGEHCTCWLFEQDSFIPLAQIKKGDIHSVITDHLGTPQEMVDRFGRIVWRLRSKAFGETLFEGAEEVSCPFRFQGQYLDSESGLHCNRFRYYDPDAGRFVSQDPIGLLGGKNLYQYVTNPTGWIDPWGLEECGGGTRVRHYTNRKGSNAIEQDGIIRARDNNRVYLELASKKPLNQIDAETKFQINPGRGRDYIETDVDNSRLEMIKNPRYGTEELTVKGDLPLENATITRRR
jgi:RHS repeat-associated protein